MTGRASKKVSGGIVLVVDVGPSTALKLAKGATFAETAKECIQVLLQQNIFLGNPNEIGIVLCGSVETSNHLFKEGKTHYQHIKVLCELEGKTKWETVESAGAEIETTDHQGDWIDALGVALDMVHARQESGTMYRASQILVFSPLVSPFRTSEKTEMAYIAALQEKNTALFFVGSSNNGQSEGRKVAARITQIDEEGAFVDFPSVFESVINFADRKSIGTPYNTTLEIGSNIRIPISGYIKLKKNDNCLTWKQETRDQSLFQKEKVYQKVSGGTAGDVDKEDVIYAYKYGSKVVPMNVKEENMFNYQSGHKCFMIIGFVGTISPHLYAGTATMYFFAQKEKKTKTVDHCAQTALSALIWGMHETEKDAIVRYVRTDNGNIKIGVLSPRIKNHYECLVFRELPFADDFRQIEFAPIVNPKRQPTAEQLNVIDHLIDTLSLETPKQEPGEPKPDTLFDNKMILNPQEQYIRNVVALRALHPDAPLPAVPEHVKMNTEPSLSMMKGAEDVFAQMKSLFPIEVVDKIKVFGSEAIKRGAVPASAEGDDLAVPEKRLREDEKDTFNLKAILGTEAGVERIGTANPVQDFFAMLETKPPETVYKELEPVVFELLQDSGGSNEELMSKARKCIKVYREHAISQGQTGVFNDWLAGFKWQVCDNYYQDFWQNHVVKEHLGLITHDESSLSTVTAQQAAVFLQIASSKPEDKEVENDADLLDLI